MLASLHQNGLTGLLLLSQKKLEKLQNTVRIISGLYGILKPLDSMQAYRLEMGTKFPVGKNKNLYEFWKKTIAQSLNDELEDNELLLNLASNEYFKAIDTKALKVPVVTTQFKDLKKSNLQHVCFNATDFSFGLSFRFQNTDCLSVIGYIFIQRSQFLFQTLHFVRQLVQTV